MVIFMNINSKFLNVCINNRCFLELSYADMASYLVDVSESDYASFESGKYLMSEENLKRICRILCVKPIASFKLEKYIDVDGLSDEEYDDLSMVVESIVGDDNA